MPFVRIMQREARVGKNNAGVFESCGWDSLLEMDFREFSMGYIYIYICRLWRGKEGI